MLSFCRQHKGYWILGGGNLWRDLMYICIILFNKGSQMLNSYFLICKEICLIKICKIKVEGKSSSEITATDLLVNFLVVLFPHRGSCTSVPFNQRPLGTHLWLNKLDFLSVEMREAILHGKLVGKAAFKRSTRVY